jgi:EAL domain-containing protein (putative c-di-GMP-specific phosphodiesterase class I)/GGDEF domain-containing protein
MSAMRMTQSKQRTSPSIRFIDQFLSQRAPGRLTGLLLGQVDAFNRISTTFGHDESTSFCARHAEQLRRSFPPGTPIIRLSERRFAVLLSPDSMASIIDVADELTEGNQPQMQVGEDSFLVDVTLGVAVHPTHAEDASSLFRRAELALESARDRELAYDIYRPDATQQQATLWKLESDLEKAIQAGELEVYYQPKVGIAGGTIEGVEALIRWRTKSGSFIPPEAFVPIAERSGSIDALTWLVFDHARAAVEQWKYFDAPFSLAINVAPQVLDHPEFHRRLGELQEALAKFNVHIIIELTEDSLLREEDDSLKNLERLRNAGVELAIDDFGKGYSSLTYLKELPANEIKIDKQFIATIGADGTDRQIVNAVINLAHALGMRVVAEGVDNEESLSVISELGCEMAQGFLIARPMRPDMLREWMAGYSPRLSLSGLHAVCDDLVSAEA